MYHRLVVPILVLSLGACTVSDPRHSDIPVTPAPRPAVNILTLYPEAVRSFERGNSAADVSSWWVREYGIEPQVAEETVATLWQTWQATARPPTIRPVVSAPNEVPEPLPVPAAPGKTKGKNVKTPTAPGAERPEAIIQEAHQHARVHPTKRGYFGNTSTHVYPYQPGRIYDVYVTPTHATKIVFPPGERLANALILDPSTWEIQQFDVGDESVSSTVVTILPVSPMAPTDVSLVTQTGRHYDLHLIVGKVGMLGVTWNLMPIPQMALDEPPLRAP